MSFGLVAYSDLNLNNGTKDLSVQISKVENGYVVSLNGYKKTRDKDAEWEWEMISKRFVYVKLEDAVKDVGEFFKKLEEWASVAPENHPAE